MEKLSMRSGWDFLVRLGLACAALLAVIFAVPNVSQACKCAPPPPPAEALQQASAVFEAQVTALSAGTDELEVSMRVTRAWKGVDTETIRVRTRQESAACGVAFETGQSWLVYANQTTGQTSAIALEVLRCGRSRLAEDADEDFTALGVGVVPVSPREPAPAAPDESKSTATPAPPPTPPQAIPPASGGCASCNVASGARGKSVLGMLLGVALVLALLLRARARA